MPEQKLDAKSIEEKAEEFLLQLREKLVELKLKGEWYSDDLRNQVIERFELDHQSVELAEESLSDGTFVRFVRADILYSEIIKDKLQDLTDGKFFRTPLKKATQATAREENRAN